MEFNSALKNVGSTVLLRERHRNQRDNSILQLAGDIVGGRIKQLFILGANPCSTHRARWRTIQPVRLGGLAGTSKKGARCNPASAITKTKLPRFLVGICPHHISSNRGAMCSAQKGITWLSNR